MSDAKPQQEPSMEEILASIRRIIAEDEKPADPASPAPPPATPAPAPAAATSATPVAPPPVIVVPPSPKDDVLELTEALNDDGSVRRVEPAEPPPPPIEHEPALPPQPVEDYMPPPPNAEAEMPRADPANRILSSATSGAAAAAFARLAGVPRDRRGDVYLNAGDRTLEEIVRDTLRPLLQSWLDANLPDLVERLVRDEIARVVGDAGLR